ncbi:hypothetical protein ACFVW2_08035 [Streptomyces sp. NPDC058171]
MSDSGRGFRFGNTMSRLADWAGLLGAGFLLVLGSVSYAQGRGPLWFVLGLVVLALNLFTFGPRQRKRREAKERVERARLQHERETA